jgi:hypothetical protein
MGCSKGTTASWAAAFGLLDCTAMRSFLSRSNTETGDGTPATPSEIQVHFPQPAFSKDCAKYIMGVA